MRIVTIVRLCYNIIKIRKQKQTTPNRRYKTMDTIEKRLKDYKGYQVYKIIDNKGTRQEKITYMLNDQEENNINCFSSLAELKKWADS